MASSSAKQDWADRQDTLDVVDQKANFLERVCAALTQKVDELKWQAT